MTASEMMTEDPITATPTTTLAQALDTLRELDARHLPVVEDDELIGMISDRDLRAAMIYGFDPARDEDGAATVLDVTVSSIMSGDVLSVEEEASLDEVIDVMLEHKLGAVPVVRVGSMTLVGIISYLDVLRAVR